MFGSNFFGQPYFGQAYALTLVSSIQWDTASNSGYQASLSTYSWSHTVGAIPANPGLIVNVSIFATGSVTGITAGGVAMKFVRADTIGVYRNEIWKLSAVATGVITIAVTLSASLTSIASADSYTGVNQTDMVESHSGTTGSISTAPTASITSVDDNSWVVSGLTTSDATMTVGGSATQRNNQTGALGTGAMSDQGPIHPAGSTTMSWSTVGSLDSWALGVIVLDPLAGTLYASVNAGALSFTGSIKKSSSRKLTGALSFTGLINKTLSHIFTAALSFSGKVTKTFVRRLLGVLSFNNILLNWGFENGLTSWTIAGTITADSTIVFSGLASAKFAEVAASATLTQNIFGSDNTSPIYIQTRFYQTGEPSSNTQVIRLDQGTAVIAAALKVLVTSGNLVGVNSDNSSGATLGAVNSNAWNYIQWWYDPSTGINKGSLNEAAIVSWTNVTNAPYNKLVIGVINATTYTCYFDNVSAGIEPLIKLTQYTPAAILSFISSIIPGSLISRLLTAGLSFSGNISRGFFKKFLATLSYIGNFGHSADIDATGTIWEQNPTYLEGAVNYDDPNTLFDAMIPFDGAVTSNITSVYPQGSILWEPEVYEGKETLWQQNPESLEGSVLYDDPNTLFDALIPFDGTDNLTTIYPTTDTIWEEPNYL